MTVNGNHTTYQNGDDRGMVQMALFYPHSSFRNDKPTLGLPKPGEISRASALALAFFACRLRPLRCDFSCDRGPSSVSECRGEVPKKVKVEWNNGDQW